jgi:hypothetical protein
VWLGGPDVVATSGGNTWIIIATPETKEALLAFKSTQKTTDKPVDFNRNIIGQYFQNQCNYSPQRMAITCKMLD